MYKKNAFNNAHSPNGVAPNILYVVICTDRIILINLISLSHDVPPFFFR